MSIIDRVKFDGLKSRDWLVYKFPNEKLVMGSQLIVNEGQAAIFVKGGQIFDIFYPGTYKLSTENLPVLSSVLNLLYGNKTPFTAEIYFINLATKLDVYWGTPDPIQLIDPKYFVKLRIRAFGQLALRLDDPLLFFKEIIVSLKKDDLVIYDKVQDYFKGMLIATIKTTLANKIIKEEISALDITAEIPSIANDLKGKIADELKLYGFNLINFHIQSINFPDEDFAQINEILQDKAQFEILGESRYQTMRSFDVYGKTQSGIPGGLGLNHGTTTPNTPPQNSIGNTNLITCPSCKESIMASSKFCNSCGVKIANKISCYSCGHDNEENSKFCSSCGTSIAKRLCNCGNEIQQNDRFCNHCGINVDTLST
nr:SPFH domain-containing protein [Lysinibacillus timonensis]